MAKRSWKKFERVGKDFYRTPREAVLPLLKFLPTYPFTFAEPCAGELDLVEWLEIESKAKCSYSNDINWENGVDALSLKPEDFKADYIITNPPWSRELLHPMIENFVRIAPTWLLFDADWVHTKQARHYLPLLTKIVSVGRVRWIPGSPSVGKDNCAWHFFKKPGRGRHVTEFYNLFEHQTVSDLQLGK